MKQISSRDNPRFKELLRLARSARARREQGTLLLEGVHLIRAYIDRFGSGTVSLFVKRSAHDHPEISAIVAGRVSAVLLDDSLFDRVAPVQSPVGIVALAQMPAALLPEV